MAKSKRNKIGDLGPVEPLRVKKCGPITPPAFDSPEAYRYSSWVRHGKFNAEVFCKNPDRRRELGLPVIIVDPMI